MLEQINFKVFLISFCVGILFVYINQPAPTIVHKFPSPDNINTIYRDEDSCYTYNYDEVACEKGALPQPIIDP
jgi:hypothetical protein